MARFDPRYVSAEIERKVRKEFFRAVTLLDNYQETEEFFKDFLTRQEVAMFSRRIQVAKMLLEGHNYQTIMGALRVGKNTVSRVANWLENGGGGFKTIIQRILKIEKDNNEALNKPFSLDDLKRRYPSYFLLDNLTDFAIERLKKRRKRKSIPQG